MTDGQFDVRPILVVLVVLIVLIATAQAAMAKSPADDGLTVVSSTVLGEGTFTMTAWNVSLESKDVSLAPPGMASAVSVDTGVFDGMWTINGLESGATATMVGRIES